MKEGFVANRFDLISGIINGTSNFILSKMAEEKVRRSEARYRVTTETASDGILIMDDQGIILLANAAAGVVVGKIGTEAVTRGELALALAEGHASTARKVVDARTLAARLAARRARGERIVFTNGCFDLLHPGHIQTLSFAKAQGDVLVVGINTDRSVRRLKGPSRPLQTQAARAAVLAGLEAVDYVVTFDDDTPAAIIREVAPDVLVKGEDWKTKGVVGRAFVESYSGRVVLAPVVPGHSTSSLIERIRKPCR
jgi:D-beta-D-heptose 7-phosphate kinase/D-beta-D-heptose 1-phosphate adenosyltransferase